MNVAELLLIPASMFPEQEMLRFEGQGTSYAALQEEVAHTASALRALGVQAGDRVAVLATSAPAVVTTLYATASLGAVFVPLNYRARSDELGHMLSVAEPRVLLLGDRYLSTVHGLSLASATAPVLATLESPTHGLPHWPTLVAQAEPIEPQEIAEDCLAVLMFTSGTTAAAKAVMLAHADLVNFVFTTTEPADGSDRGSVLLAAPLYHIAGLTATLTATFAGRRIVLMRQFEADRWLRLVASERVTHAFLVPTMLKRVLDHPNFPSADLSSLQVLSYGAAPMPLNVIQRAIETFPPSVQFINAFGQTETTSTVTMLGPEDHRLDGAPEELERRLRRLTSIGRPLPDVEVRILDEQGAPLPPGQVGEIAIRAARLMRGYYGQADATRSSLDGGWLRTRDLGWVDDEGYIYLAGRSSDLIIRGGENIAPEEIERVLEAHPAVEEAAAIGLPDEEWGERVAAVIVRRPDNEVSAETLIEFCREQLASFKKPEVVIFTDALPRNALGKLLRKELRAQYEGMTENGGMRAESGW